MIDRAGVEQQALDLVHAAVRRGTPPGASVVIEGAAGLGKTFLARKIMDSVPPDEARKIFLAAEPGRRHEPYGPLAAAGVLPTGHPDAAGAAEAAFDRVDELCGAGPVVLGADDAQFLDAATLTLLRRLVWASRSLPLVVLITTRPAPSRASVAMLIRAAQTRLVLPPMGRMMMERLVFDRTGRWPGPVLRGVLELAAGHPLFATELLRAYRDAGALAETGPDTIEARFELGPQATGLDELIRAHLGELDQPARDLVDALAVWGADSTEAELAQLLAVRPAELPEPLEQAIGSGLVRREPSGTIGFHHDLFREVAYGELPGATRGDLHRRTAQLLSVAGHRPALVADHLLRAGGEHRDPALGTALLEAMAATRSCPPEVTADLLDDVAATSGPDVPPPMLVDYVTSLFRHGRAQSAEAVVRARIAAVTDPSVAARLQLFLIRSLINRADVPAALAAIAASLAVPGLPGPAARQLESIRAFVLTMVGEPLPAAEVDALIARFTAAGDLDAEVSMTGTAANAEYLAGRPARAAAMMRDREALLPAVDQFRGQSSTALVMPVTFQLAAYGPPAATEALERARRLSADRDASWVGPFLSIAAGGIAFTAGDWNGAIAELDTALEQAEEASSGWISVPVGTRSYIDAHQGRGAQARARLESFRHRGLPLHFGQDRPGWAELAVLETDGAIREADTLARTLWSRIGPNQAVWAGELAVDLTRVALAAMDQHLANQLRDDVAGLCAPDLAQLVRGTIDADPDAIEAAAGALAAAGRRTLEAFAREELACAAAAAGDRDRATRALEAALAGYQQLGAVADRDRARQRVRALGIRRGPRAAHRDTDSGWAALTPTEARIAVLVREGLTNREIGTRMFVSPRTVQTHVSHILQKTGLRSRVEVARAAGEQIRRMADVSAASPT
ncbi:MAG TPA: LuxR C-terminal-related transcriptional regulator [Streptosporangiaceae bacterium]|nr:LuxR C-terminal-related transcriptional regulator [Streptosporangiaceae bacterium]